MTLRMALSSACLKCQDLSHYNGHVMGGEFSHDSACTHTSFFLFFSQELILFSRADLERSIPCMVDGLKPGQRKILFACFKRNLKKDIKVSLEPCLCLSRDWGEGVESDNGVQFAKAGKM